MDWLVIANARPKDQLFCDNAPVKIQLARTPYNDFRFRRSIENGIVHRESIRAGQRMVANFDRGAHVLTDFVDYTTGAEQREIEAERCRGKKMNDR